MLSATRRRLHPRFPPPAAQPGPGLAPLPAPFPNP
jgi:hypothetical protein